MTLPTFTEAMQGFTVKGLTATEALKKRTTDWNWSLGASLTGRYLDGNDLAACCLVSKHFRDNFMPILWSKPLAVLETKQKPFSEYGVSFHDIFNADGKQSRRPNL